MELQLKFLVLFAIYSLALGHCLLVWLVYANDTSLVTSLCTQWHHPEPQLHQRVYVIQEGGGGGGGCAVTYPLLRLARFASSFGHKSRVTPLSIRKLSNRIVWSIDFKWPYRRHRHRSPIEICIFVYDRIETTRAV